MPDPADLLDLSRRERQIMDVLYRIGHGTADEVRRVLDQPPTTTTVRTLLRILEDKGFVRHDLDGLSYVYHPVLSRESAAAQVLPHVVRTFFGGSAAKAMSSLLGPDGAQLDDAEIDRLTALVEAARRRPQ